MKRKSVKGMVKDDGVQPLQWSKVKDNVDLNVVINVETKAETKVRNNVEPIWHNVWSNIGAYLKIRNLT